MKRLNYYKKVGGEVIEAKSVKHNALKIEVYYSKGGLNYFNYNQESRGVWVSFSKVELSKSEFCSSECSSPFDKVNFKIFVKELSRLSQKKVQEVYEKIGRIKEQLFDCYGNGDREIIFGLLKSIS